MPGVLGACGGGPCEVCADVAGSYEETLSATTASASSCDALYSRGGSWTVRVTQSGSRVTVGGLDAATSGVLNDDLSMQIDSVPGIATDPNGGPGTPITLLLSGVFEGEQGSRTFVGVYQATGQTNDCVTRIRTRWTQVKR